MKNWDLMSFSSQSQRSQQYIVAQRGLPTGGFLWGLRLVPRIAEHPSFGTCRAHTNESGLPRQLAVQKFNPCQWHFFVTNLETPQILRWDITMWQDAYIYMYLQFGIIIFVRFLIPAEWSHVSQMNWDPASAAATEISSRSMPSMISERRQRRESKEVQMIAACRVRRLFRCISDGWYSDTMWYLLVGTAWLKSSRKEVGR